MFAQGFSPVSTTMAPMMIWARTPATRPHDRNTRSRLRGLRRYDVKTARMTAAAATTSGGVNGGRRFSRERNPASTRHRAWSTNGEGTTRFEWVPLETSLQWAAFQRLTELLRARGNELFLLVGPFNEHLMAAENRPAYRALRDGVTAWLRAQKVAHYAPDALASTLYADASHPLTDGYRELAHQLWQAPEFAAFARGAKP